MRALLKWAEDVTEEFKVQAGAMKFIYGCRYHCDL